MNAREIRVNNATERGTKSSKRLLEFLKNYQKENKATTARKGTKKGFAFFF